MTSNSTPTSSHGPALPYPNVARGQFLRVEKFAVVSPRGKSGGNNIAKVAHGAVRTAGYCPHIEQPEPPILLYGVSPLDAAARAQEWARQQTDHYHHISCSTPLTRKFRADKPCTVVGVISAPPEWLPDERWAQFCSASLAWLKRKYGEDRLCSLLEHRDERWLHMHFWVVPHLGETFSAIHQGEKALDKVGRKAARVIRDAAYKKAMSQLLDEFSLAVGSNFGLARETVNGTRRSREDWQRKQYLDSHRELEVQRRIAQAVDAAIHQTRLDIISKVTRTKLVEQASLLTPVMSLLPLRSNHAYPNLLPKQRVQTQEAHRTGLDMAMIRQIRQTPTPASRWTLRVESLVKTDIAEPRLRPGLWVRPRGG